MCGEFDGEADKHSRQKLLQEFGRFLKEFRVCRFHALSLNKSRVENQAGERVGAVNGNRLGSQRTATPTASIFRKNKSVIRYKKCYGAEYVAMTPYQVPFLIFACENKRINRRQVMTLKKEDNMPETERKKKEIKRRFQLWIKPSTLELADKVKVEANCSSQSEFIEKAVLFYVGYLSAESNKSYLPNVVTSTLKSIVAESDNKQNRVLFKLAVEMAVMMNLMAANNDIDKVALERLRGECVKEVKRLNGSFSFNDALDWQKG